MNTFKSVKMAGLCAVLSLAMIAQGCAFSVSQFEAVLQEVGPAVLTVLQIVALVKGGTANTALPAKIDSDVAGLEKLYTDWQAADATSKAGVEAQINTSFAVLTADLGTVFSIAQVSDVRTQEKISALLGLIQSAVQIAEAAIPNPATKAGKPLALTASGLADSYDKILVAKTGNAAVDAYTPTRKIHNHGKFLRTLTLGVAK